MNKHEIMRCPWCASGDIDVIRGGIAHIQAKCRKCEARGPGVLCPLGSQYGDPDEVKTTEALVEWNKAIVNKPAISFD